MRPASAPRSKSKPSENEEQKESTFFDSWIDQTFFVQWKLTFVYMEKLKKKITSIFTTKKQFNYKFRDQLHTILLFFSIFSLNEANMCLANTDHLFFRQFSFIRRNLQLHNEIQSVIAKETKKNEEERAWRNVNGLIHDPNCLSFLKWNAKRKRKQSTYLDWNQVVNDGGKCDDRIEMSARNASECLNDEHDDHAERERWLKRAGRLTRPWHAAHATEEQQQCRAQQFGQKHCNFINRFGTHFRTVALSFSSFFTPLDLVAIR